LADLTPLRDTITNMKWGRKKDTPHIGYLPMREVDPTKPTRERRPFRHSGNDRGRPAGPKAALSYAMLRVRNLVVGSRGLLILVVLLGVLLLVLALFISRTATGARDREMPLDLNSVGPDVIVAEVAGVSITSPIRPEDLTALGYHADGKDLVGMSPRGRESSGSFLYGLFDDTATQEKIRYHLMDSAGRSGPSTGALDVGAQAGSAVYAPVTGTVVAIRLDPLLRAGANVVVIKPTDNPDVWISVSLLKDIAHEVGPGSPVTAGVTELGSVVDSQEFFKPQLSSYTSGDGNHVTVSASRVS
jgi:hypothetical protein